jgi:hypothetical protein
MSSIENILPKFSLFVTINPRANGTQPLIRHELSTLLGAGYTHKRRAGSQQIGGKNAKIRGVWLILPAMLAQFSRQPACLCGDWIAGVWC